MSDSCPITCAAADVGALAGVTGAVHVSGAGSTWNSSGATLIGAIGNGTLTIDTGGQVSTGTLRVGTQPGSYGIVTIDSGGQLTNTTRGSIGEVGGLRRGGDRLRFPMGRQADLYVGFAGQGTLTISSGGEVTDVNAPSAPLPDPTATCSLTRVHSPAPVRSRSASTAASVRSPLWTVAIFRPHL